MGEIGVIPGDIVVIRFSLTGNGMTSDLGVILDDIDVVGNPRGLGELILTKYAK